VFQAHGALVTFRRGVGLVDEHVGVGDRQALAADAASVVAFDHRLLLAPLAVAEIADDIAHLDVVFIGAWLSHAQVYPHESRRPCPAGAADIRHFPLANIHCRSWITHNPPPATRMCITFAAGCRFRLGEPGYRRWSLPARRAGVP